MANLLLLVLALFSASSVKPASCDNSTDSFTAEFDVDCAKNNGTEYCGAPISRGTGIYCYDCGDGYQYFSIINETGSVVIDTCNIFASYIFNNVTSPYYDMHNISKIGAYAMGYDLDRYSVNYNCTFYTAVPEIHYTVPSCNTLGLSSPQWNIDFLPECYKAFVLPAIKPEGMTILKDDSPGIKIFVGISINVGTAITMKSLDCLLDYFSGSSVSGIPFCMRKAKSAQPSSALSPAASPGKSIMNKQFSSVIVLLYIILMSYIFT